MVVVGATDLTDDFGSSVRGGYGRPPPSCFPGPILPVYDVQVHFEDPNECGWRLLAVTEGNSKLIGSARHDILNGYVLSSQSMLTRVTR
ncbi:hypothetical protein V9T40_002958 [Parthenolecanium corni]|uniref:Uncharacterized protein n=1 Tax=Parthenolecanium corni TaxID=536013 RepID=A0AAN9Y975_9HEMI